jgi:uncharacterized membrane protein YoaK (UPF0700 family)
MNIWSDVVGTAWPGKDSRDGPLPPLLLLMTVVTGFVDAASYLELGRVFVANMTGNVVFLGFAIAGASGLSIWASLTALGSFLFGSFFAGRITKPFAGHRGKVLRAALVVQVVVVTAAACVVAAGGDPVEGGRRYAVIALLASAMGLQNATVRRLAVPELTTTVLTMTLTGIAADATLAGGKGSKIGRRSLAIAAMLTGALLGALLALKVDTTAPLVAAAGLLAVTAVLTHLASRSQASWTQPA